MNDYVNAKYPMIARSAEIARDWLAIRSFIERAGYVLCEYDEHNDLYPVMKPLNQVLNEYFGIDTDQLDTEREAVFEEMRARAEGRS